MRVLLLRLRKPRAIGPPESVSVAPPIRCCTSPTRPPSSDASPPMNLHRRLSAAAALSVLSLLHRAACPGPGHRAAHRAAQQPGDPRPDLDHRLHEPQPRLHDLRHPVRHRRERQGQAADGGELDREPRPPAVDLQAAQGAGIPRRQAGHRRRRDRLAAALGQARRHGLGADAVRPAHGFTHARHLPHLPGRGLRLRARGAGQAQLERAVHHAQAHRRDRCLQADRGAHRLRPLHLQERRVQARRQGGVPEERQVRAAQRAAVGHHRRQERLRRPGRMEPGAA